MAEKYRKDLFIFRSMFPLFFLAGIILLAAGRYWQRQYRRLASASMPVKIRSVCDNSSDKSNANTKEHVCILNVVIRVRVVTISLSRGCGLRAKQLAPLDFLIVRKQLTAVQQPGRRKPYGTMHAHAAAQTRDQGGMTHALYRISTACIPIL
jgi:hypothetical protein